LAPFLHHPVDPAGANNDEWFSTLAMNLRDAEMIDFLQLDYVSKMHFEYVTLLHNVNVYEL